MARVLPYRYGGLDNGLAAAAMSNQGGTAAAASSLTDCGSWAHGSFDRLCIAIAVAIAIGIAVDRQSARGHCLSAASNCPATNAAFSPPARCSSWEQWACVAAVRNSRQQHLWKHLHCATSCSVSRPAHVLDSCTLPRVDVCCVADVPSRTTHCNGWQVCN